VDDHLRAPAFDRAPDLRQEVPAGADLVDEHGDASPDCSFELRPGTSVTGPHDLKMSSGRYQAEFSFSSDPRCGEGDVRIEIALDGRFGRLLSRFDSRVHPGETLDLPFRLRVMDAALGTVVFRLDGDSDCVLLSKATWQRL
jgi:hypothetical protein